ncbi:sensor histidine kinase [Phenylobacterium sp.]|uniref:sensor histidine kinase n=1 Tax=Phenylobacterium sp. TaxID=1871053 RepID=UPI002736D391|nr:HWE histidine kinase domain-containing protein [Phenylobacterium sp.]MDP3658687.1 HWE histidine kinase domain-containing protein [Phenylobacterium sp.]
MSNETPSALGLPQARIAELIIDHARDYAIFTMELGGRITSWSTGAERITGYTPDEAVGMDFQAFFTASDQSTGQAQLELDKAWRDGRAEDTRWHVRKNGERFWANGVTSSFIEGELKGLVKVMRDETRNRLADEQRILLLNELNHRINNTLVTVQSLVEQTLRATDTDRSIRENLTARLLALSDAHRLLVDQNWAGADLEAIVEKALAPYQDGDRSRLRMDGPNVRLSPQQAVSMALVLHELTTNAVKYGALSVPDGFVETAWNLHYDELGARHMTFLWQEHGGPAVTEPMRRGFGSRLISRSFGEDGGGEARIEFHADGVRCGVHLPLITPAEMEMMDPTAIHQEAGD